jgi:dinuclear metal center YbgI/SA1388 family protein
MTVALATLAAYLDDLLRVRDIRDYPTAVNGVQVSHRGPVRKVASAVDASLATITRAADAGANLLLVHHGLFWAGLQPMTGFRLDRFRLLLERDIAVYSVHLPLDAHDRFGNSRLLADRLGLAATAGFAPHDDIWCGVSGETSARSTSELIASLDAFAREHGGRARASSCEPSRQTKHWAVCSGAGANAETLAEAEARGVDTLITGEGAHWTAVDAPERGLVIIYAGHYATETLGVRAVGAHLTATFGVEHEFIPAPTGL